MAKKAAPTQSKDTNPKSVVFPRLYFNSIRSVQRLGLQVITAVNGDEKRYKAVKETLTALLEFNEVRYKDDKKLREEKLAAKLQAREDAEKAAQEATEAQEAARVAELRAELDTLVKGRTVDE